MRKESLRKNQIFDKRLVPAQLNGRVRQASDTLLVKILIGVLAMSLLLAVMLQLPYFGDWQRFFYPVRQNLGDPYSEIGFLNPVWVVWIIALFTIFDVHLRGAIWMTLSTIAVIWCIHQLQGGLLAVALSLLSPAYIRFITAGQIDALPFVGLALLVTVSHLPAKGLGLILMSVKPQTLGAGALCYWIGMERRQKLIVLLPLAVVFLVSIAIYGFWPSQIQMRGLNQKVDFGPWPYGIPIGLFLLWWSIRKDQPAWGATATFFLVPYVSPSSVFVYSALIFAISPKWFALGLFVFLWAFSLLAT